jgi:hypothetical protein
LTRNFCPVVAVDRVEPEESRVFRRKPALLGNGRRELADPSLAALFLGPRRNESGDAAPGIRSEHLHCSAKSPVLFMVPFGLVGDLLAETRGESKRHPGVIRFCPPKSHP